MQCGKGFTRLFSLTTHTRFVFFFHLHNCWFFFFRSRNKLLNYLFFFRNVHEGQKNHKCNYCDKSFCRAHDVKKHMSSAHNINTWRCDVYVWYENAYRKHCERFWSFYKMGKHKMHIIHVKYKCLPKNFDIWIIRIHINVLICGWVF